MANNGYYWSLSRILMWSAVVGVIGLLLFLIALGFKFFGALLWGVIIAVVTFFVLWLNFGRPEDWDESSASSGSASASSGSSAAGGASGSTSSATGAGTSSAAAATTAAATSSASSADGASSDASGSSSSDSDGSSSASSGAGAKSADAADSGSSSADAAGASGASETKAKPKAKSGSKSKTEAKSGGAKKASPTDGGDKDYDKDGVKEGKDEGTKPAMLSAARDGGADNLKEIKGIGPKLEKLCHSLGVFHFDQIAAWGADEVAWMDANLEGFRGRVSRDDWVGQAKILASGGETEFSQRVDDGKVY